MDDIIDKVVQQRRDVDFVVTHPLSKTYGNVTYSGDITGAIRDLHQVGILSRYADLIVGRNSGPFIYCTEWQNMMNPKKTFLTFNRYERDSLAHGLDIKANFYIYTEPYWGSAANIILAELNLVEIKNE
jgi:hypothetical protein